MGRGREVDVASPDLIERVDGGPYHTGQRLDVFKLAEIRFRKCLPDSVPKAIGIDWRKKTSGKSPCQLAYREDLNAVSAGAGGADSGHVPGESRVHHDRAPHVSDP